MTDRKLIRLIIYLIISIALIILLWYLSQTNTDCNKTNTQNPDRTVNTVIPVDLPVDNNSERVSNLLKLEIDSANSIHFDNKIIKPAELESLLRVQREKNPKQIIGIFVHPQSKSAVFLSLLETAQKMKLKIKIITVK